MADTLTHALLRDYADAFLVRGAPSNPVWFLEPEPRGGATLDEAAREIEAWDRAGRPVAADPVVPTLDDASARSPFERVDGEPASPRTTWSNQLRVLAGLRGEPQDAATVRRLQAREREGRGSVCRMDLFALPCRDADAWVYDRVPHDPDADGPNPFASKREYREHYLPRRLGALAALVREHRPTALVCMGWTHRGQIVSLLEGGEVPELGLEGAKRRAVIGRLGDTVVAVCSHPAKRIGGPRNEFYHRLGVAIAERMAPEAGLALAA